MPLITFQPSGKSVIVPPGTELLAAARQAGIEIDSPCGGKGTCGKCIVQIHFGKVDTDSLGLLSQTAVDDGFVLACKTRVLETPLTVEIPERLGREGGKFSDGDETFLVRGELLPQRWEYDPLAVKWCVTVASPQLQDGLSDLDRLARRIQQEWGKDEVIYPLSVIRQAADILRAQKGLVTVTLIREPGRLHVIKIEAGDCTVRHYGIAIDIGTTTVAVQLVYLPLAEIVTTRSDYNDQVSCGLDVISRINYARTPERLDELRQRVLDTVNRLIRQVAEGNAVVPAEICNAVISGNTTMIHLLLGLKPEYIRRDPYTPTLMEAPYLSAADVGLEINPESWVYFSPAVGSYVGGDITAGALCTELAVDGEEVNFFIDIGTNGEMVIGNREFLLTCACSAGPAFEGGGIDCGMRAARGAIEKVEVDAETGVAKCWTIGNVRPKGICGSGMISLLADLFLKGWIDAAGKLNRSRPSPAIEIHGRHAHYVLVPLEESGLKKPLVIHELDIENIIRAKAAIYAACGLLLEHAGLSYQDLSNIFIAGGFGRYLDIDKATVLGLIPDLPREKFHYIGNASLLGSYMVLVSQDYRRKQIELARRMTYIELSSDPRYMDQYTAALFLPHTNPELFPTIHRKLADA